jgi:sn-glycerol 3-phosphate transport system substrate-binding protein
MAIAVLLGLLVGATAVFAQTRVVFWYSIGGPNGEEVVRMAKKFNESQNAIVVEAQSQGSYEDIVTKLVAAVPARKQPALAQMDLMFIPHFIEMGVLEPLDAYLSAADKDAFIPSFLQQATYKGKLMSMPFGNSIMLLFYNRDLVRAAGLNPDMPATTWDETVEAAKKLTKDTDGDGRTDQWGYFLRYTNDYEYQGLIQTAGGACASGPDMKTIAWNSAEGQRALQYMVDLVYKHKVMPLVGSAGGAQATGGTDLFYAGKLGMTISSSASLAPYKANMKADFAGVFPPADKKKVAVGGGSNIILLKGLDKTTTTAAATFLKWLTSAENSASWARFSGYLPTKKAAAEQMKQYAAENPTVAASFAALQYMGPRTHYMGPEGPRVHTFLREAISTAVYDIKTVKRALDEAAADAQKVVDSFKSPF